SQIVKDGEHCRRLPVLRSLHVEPQGLLKLASLQCAIALQAGDKHLKRGRMCSRECKDGFAVRAECLGHVRTPEFKMSDSISTLSRQSVTWSRVWRFIAVSEVRYPMTEGTCCSVP